jgi:hypothetical protein
MARVERIRGGPDFRDGIARKGTLVGVDNGGPRTLNAGVPLGLLALFLPQSWISTSAARSASGS